MGKVGKGLGYYSDIGRKTKDLLTKDYTYDQKFTVSTTTKSGLTFTTRGAKHRNAFFGDVTTSFKNKNITTELKVDTQSNVRFSCRLKRKNITTDIKVGKEFNIFATVVVDDCAPGAKAVFSFTIPDHHSGKIELQYCHEYGSVTGGIGLTSSPIVEATGCVGSDGFAFGGEMAFDTALGCLTKYNAAVGFTKPDFSASLIVADKGDLLKASYLHTVSPTTKTTVAAEIAHKISKNENTFTVGGLYELDTITMLKTRMNNHGKLAALLQHEWRPKSLLTISGEVDTKALDKHAKIGLAFSLKP
ncbi:hypothetical protein BDL97_10G101200 [Sphagnum fallax]|nr:hypothetical protein BDL97_10G101200 [Sphagnum fallax]KAH8950750.1 hypothetical protein BDL97_10G101200 [Sphagnum fallax]KAH8950751.1 hypothetical protein BDL97_10G101200 [Sphagnum fallax]KAH8950753.1 hypothetical protein BDL97_10G101200 [Sphagnum fallax]KAH8950754.1 hypothetical protein BDL97_10G101200 [Sphagnum fallax]